MSRIRSAQQRGAPTFGVFQKTTSSVVAEVLGRLQFDWIAVDLQHGAVSWDSLLGIVQAIGLGGADVIVRVPWNDPAQIMRALDLGATGVIVPMVSTAEDARRAAEAARYPPQGIRSFGRVREGYSLGSGNPTEALAASNRQVLCLVMIETAAGLQNIEAIAATPGVDGIFLGPADLSLSLGVGFAGWPSRQLLDAIDRTVQVCATNRILAGMATAGGKQNVEDMLKRGMRLLAIGSDMGYLLAGAGQDSGLSVAWKSEFPG